LASVIRRAFLALVLATVVVIVFLAVTTPTAPPA
jgi:hypothetical protein